MLEYDKIDVSEWIDVNKTSASKEYDICHFWHDLMQKAMSFNDVAIVYVKFTFGIWTKMMQLAWWKILTWLIKKVFCNFF